MMTFICQSDNESEMLLFTIMSHIISIMNTNTLEKNSRLFDIILSPLYKNSLFFIFMFFLGGVCIYVDPEIEINLSLFFCLFFDVYLACLIIFLFPRKLHFFLKLLICFSLYVLAVVDVFCIENIGGGITPTLVEVFLDTNENEAKEALISYITRDAITSKVLIIVLYPILYMLIYILFCYKRSKSFEETFFYKEILDSKLINVLLIISLLISIFFSTPRKKQLLGYFVFPFEVIKKNYNANNVYLPIYKLLYSIRMNSLMADDLEPLINKVKSTRTVSCSFRSPMIVLIIGESHNRHHSQLYGYTKPVSPFQLSRMKDGDLFPFSNVISSYRLTRYSFKNMFSFFHYGGPGSWNDYTLFPSVFKKAGYHVSFITNQFTNSNNVSHIDFADAFFNNVEIDRLSFDCRNLNRHQFDEGLLTDYDSLRVYNKQNNLIIFHLMGQHARYKERYPQKWNRFSIKDYSNRKDLDDSKKQLLAEYDNASLYNDYVLNLIIKKFEKENAIIIYVPDHGEACFDDGHTSGRPQSNRPEDLFQVYDIPFWIYMTKQYQMKRPDIVREVREAKDKPFMTDDLSQMLIYLAGIVTSDYKPEDNLLSPQFNVKRKRLIKGELDYDSIMKGYCPPLGIIEE